MQHLFEHVRMHVNQIRAQFPDGAPAVPHRMREITNSIWLPVPPQIPYRYSGFPELLQEPPIVCTVVPCRKNEHVVPFAGKSNANVNQKPGGPSWYQIIYGLKNSQFLSVASRIGTCRPLSGRRIITGHMPSVPCHRLVVAVLIGDEVSWFA